jgi:hypothetical protein
MSEDQLAMPMSMPPIATTSTVVKAPKEESLAPLPHKKDREYLTADPALPGQDWCVMAFISPEDRIKQRSLYEMDKFLVEMMNEYIVSSAVHMARSINAELQKKFEAHIVKLKKSVTEGHQLIAQEMTEIRRKMQIVEEDFAKECGHKHCMEQEDLLAKYEDFRIRRVEELEREFNKKFGNQTSVRGFKFCGAFPYEEAAVERANFLAENVERGVDHFVGKSFEWLPFDPNPDAIKDIRYLNKELNELMKRKKENEEMKDKFFEERKRELVTKATDQNKNLKAELKKKYTDRKKQLTDERLGKKPEE